MTAQRLVVLYSRALVYAGPALLVAVLLADRRWTGQVPELVALLAGGIALRGLQIPLSKYSYLTQTGLVAMAGSLLVGLPATALAVGVSTFAVDWLWLRKAPQAAAVNLGRELIAAVAAYGVYAGLVHASSAPPGLHVETLPGLFFYGLCYFVCTRLLFYFALIIRGKLEQSERLLILRYECISFGATIIAAACVVGTVVYWPPVAWLFVGAVLGAIGLLFKKTMEEAIAAEELNKVHAMEAVITSNVSLHDSFARIERLAHRLMDWGDFRIYRHHEGQLALAYRGEIGRAEREEPSPDVAELRRQVVTSGESVLIDDVTRDRRVTDASLNVQSLVIMPLKFGDQVIGTFELDHHKRKSYRPKDLVTITT
ncbi:MAG: hypothetical protein DMD49_13835, partial [Gemmatimonadetes bacterium]